MPTNIHAKTRLHATTPAQPPRQIRQPRVPFVLELGKHSCKHQTQSKHTLSNFKSNALWGGTVLKNDGTVKGAVRCVRWYGTVGTVGTVRWVRWVRSCTHRTVYPPYRTHRTHCTVPTVPTVPYPPYPPYRTHRTHRTVPSVPPVPYPAYPLYTVLGESAWLVSTYDI